MFVTHRDLHPGNIILLNEDIDLHSKRPDYKTIILDWGQSYSRMHFEYSENDSDDMVTIHNGIGREITNSFYNLPPETFIDWEASGSEYNKYDSWAMGLLLYKLVTGKDLFSFKNIGEYAAAQKRIEWEVKFGLFDLSAYAASAAPILSALIVRLLRKDPKDRIFIQEARHALWFILVEDFMPSDFGMIQRFLDAPNYFDEVEWKHFDSEPFDYF
jgi:serine/threonine protein kinase